MSSQMIGAESQRSTQTRDALRGLRISYQTTGLVVGVVEAVMITFGSAFGQLAYETAAGFHSGDLGAMLGVGLLSSVLYVSVARSAGLYCLASLINPFQHVRRIIAVCGLVLFSLTAVLFLMKVGSDFSRGALLGFSASMLALCCLTRIGAAAVLDAFVTRDAIAGRPAFVIGETEELASLTPSYLLRQFGLQEVGRLALNNHAGDQDGAWRSRIDEALELGRSSRAKEFVVASKWDRLDRLTELEKAFSFSPLPVRLMPNQVFRSVMGRHTSTYEQSVHLIELQRAPMSLAEQAAKRVVDIAFASAALLLLLPVFVIAACAVKLDSKGPIIFRQRRNGFDQHPFVILKFRTMKVLEDADVVVQAKRGDHRITRVGRFLRKSSVDELPQLINVLRGDMSIVGPRPHAMAHDNEYKALIEEYCMRHHVKPGITGWAQVNGFRGETVRTEHMKKRVDLDCWYINNWSLLLDFQIIVRTCVEVLKHDAY